MKIHSWDFHWFDHLSCNRCFYIRCLGISEHKGSPFCGHPLYPCEGDSPEKAKKRRQLRNEERERERRRGHPVSGSLGLTAQNLHPLAWPGVLTDHDGLSEAGKVAQLVPCLPHKQEVQV